MSLRNTSSGMMQAVELLKQGGVVVYPTETVYGIGCDPFNAIACARIRKIKGRSDDKPFLLIASDIRHIELHTGPLNGNAGRLAEAFWPGPLTLILAAPEGFPEWLTGTSGGVAFRVTPHPVAAALASGFGGVIVSTSANLTGAPPAISYSEALMQFENAADMVLDNPAPMQGVPSTIIDLTSDEPVIIREGEITREVILRTLNP